MISMTSIAKLLKWVIRYSEKDAIISKQLLRYIVNSINFSLQGYGIQRD